MTAELGTWGGSYSLPSPKQLSLDPQGEVLLLLLGQHRLLCTHCRCCKPAPSLTTVEHALQGKQKPQVKPHMYMQLRNAGRDVLQQRDVRW